MQFLQLVLVLQLVLLVLVEHLIHNLGFKAIASQKLTAACRCLTLCILPPDKYEEYTVRLAEFLLSLCSNSSQLKRQNQKLSGRFNTKRNLYCC